MKRNKPTYGELQERLLEAESVLESIQKGKVDMLLGETQPLVIQLKSVTEEKDRLLLENQLLAHEWVSTFETINSLIWVIDKDNTIIRNNKNSLAGFGFETENPLGKNYFDIVKCPDAQSSECPLSRAKESLKRERTEILIDDNWFELIVDPIIYNGYQGAVHLVNNITPQKKAEQELKESRERLELFFAQSLDGFFFMMLDEPVVWNDSIDKEKTLDYVFKHHRITKANKAMLEQYGAAEEQLIGLTPNDLFKHDIEHGRQVWEDFFDKGQLHVDTHEKKFDGTDMIIEGDYICLYDAQKRITGHFGVQRDITEIRRNEINLRSSEAYNRLLFNSSPIGLALCKMDGSMVDVNFAYANILGRTIEETLKLSYWDITPKKYADQEGQQLKSLDETGRYGPYEKEYIHKDGHLVPVRLHGLIFKQEGERFILSSVEDITERKLAEEKLQRWAHIFGHAQMGIAVSSENGKNLALMNPMFAWMHGYTVEELIGKPVLYVYAPEARDELAKHIKIANEKGHYTFESIHNRKDGTTFPVQMDMTAVYDENGKFMYRVVNCQDITERKRAEKELLASETRYRRLFESAKDGILILDAGTGMIVDVNPFLIELLGYSKEEFLLKKIWDVGFFKDIIANQANFLELQQKEYIRYEDLPLETSGGQTIHVEFISNVYQVNHHKVIQCNIRDITGRKQAEEELRAKTEELNKFFDTSLDLLCIADTDGYFHKLNPEWEKTLGYNLQELEGKKFLDFIHPDDLEGTLANISDLSSQKDVVDFVNRYRCKDGTYRWIEWRSTPVGKLIFAAARDITERKQAEEALRESHEQLKKVLEVETVGVMFWDLTTGCMTNANDAFLNLMGYSRLEVEARELTWQKLTPPEYVEASLAEIRKFQATGRVGPYEKEYLRKDGTRQWLVFAGSSLGGNTCVEFCVDISGRKQAEKALMESEERYRLVQENSMDAILFTAPDGTIFSANPAACKMFKRTEEEICSIGRNGLVDINDPRLPILLEERVRTGKARGELMMIRKDGTKFPVELSTSVFVDHNNEKRTSMIIRDITERIHAEEEIIKSKEQLELLYKHINDVREEERTSISREIHDDLGQSLAGLKIDLIGMKENLDKTSKQKMTKAISLVSDTIKSVQKLASQLRPQMLDELGLSSAIEWHANEFIKRTGIKCKLELEDIEDLEGNIPISMFRIFQASLTNIMLHSKATSISVKLATNDEMLLLSVIDDGIGITPEQINSTKSFGITGMRERANQINGKFEIHSEVNKGTEIIVTVPLKRQ
jgi:PAS domain S-box-containing protein